MYRLNVSGRGDSSNRRVYARAHIITLPGPKRPPLYFQFRLHTHTCSHTHAAPHSHSRGPHAHPRGPRRARERETERARAVTVAVTHTDRERRGSSIGIRLYPLAREERRVLQSYLNLSTAFAVRAHARDGARYTLVERVQHQTSRSKGCTRLGCIRTGGAL